MSSKLFKRLISVSVVLSVIAPSGFEIARAEDGVTSTEISFGAAYPKTGALSPGMSSYYNGIRAYFSYVNDNGGVFGRKLNLLEGDSQGIPSSAIAVSNSLLLRDKVFGFLSSAPNCSEHIAFLGSLRLAERGVPDILSDCNYLTLQSSEGDDSTNKFATTTYNKLNNEAESLILKKHIDNNFAGKKVALLYQDDDLGIWARKIFSSGQVICQRAFVAGVPFAPNCNSSTAPLQNGDVVVYLGSAAGLMLTISNYVSQNLTLKYFVNYEAYNPKAFFAYGRSIVTSLAEIYAISTNSLVSDSSNEAVATFLSISQKYAQSGDIDQRFLNGMNSGYLVANVIGAVGPDLTRVKFQQALLQFGNQFDVLGLFDRSTSINSELSPTGGVVVKYLGNTSQIVSEILVVTDGLVGQKAKKNVFINAKGLPNSKQILVTLTPTPTPTPTPTQTQTPTPTPIPIVEIDGEDEEPFGKITIKKEKTKYTISILSNLPNEPLQVRATKKGQKAIIYKVITNDDGAAKFTTTRALAGFQLVLLLDGEILSSVKAG